MEIRKTETGDVETVVGIYEKAREFMRRSGNPNQWRPDYPSKESLLQDIKNDGSYVCLHEGRIVATFFFVIGEEPTYKVIKEGEWLNDQPYGVIHRVATDGTVKGVMHQVLDFCFGKIPNIRIDTHRDNKVMQNSLLRYGFEYCGIINLANGSERVAFQRNIGR